jgi:hypothetical protein
MGCSKYKSLFTAYLDGELPDTKRREIEAHLADCQTCQEALKQISLIISTTKELEKKETSPYFVSKVMQRIKEEETRLTTVTTRLRLKLAFTFASVIVVALIGSFSYYHFRSGIFKTERVEGPVLQSQTFVVERVPEVLDTSSKKRGEVRDGYPMEVEFTSDDSIIYVLPVYSSGTRVMTVSY